MNDNTELLADFHNIHVGERVFILGNGPSLLTHDLRPLANEYTFGCNSIGEWAEMPFEPTYYGLSDIQEWKWLDHNNFQQWKDVARFNVQFEGWATHDAYYNVVKAHDSYQASVEGFCGFDDTLPAIPTARSTPMTIAQLAIWMGFREFYFLGYENTRGYVYEPDRTVSMRGHQLFNIDKNVKYSLAIQRNARRLREDLEAQGGCVYDCTPEGFLNGLGPPRRGIGTPQIWEFRELSEVLS